MGKIFLLFFFSVSVATASTQYKDFPELTAELSDIKSNDLLGVKSDLGKKMFDKGVAAKKFVRNLHGTVFQLHDGCAATLISEDGYAVTALHCLKGFKTSQSYPLRRKVLVTTPSGGEIAAHVSIPEMEGYVYENWKFNPSRFVDHKDLAPVKLVALGKGYTGGVRGKGEITLSDLVTNSAIQRSHNDDYAIIKLNKMPKNFSCAKTATAMPSSSSIAWAAGYPVHTRPATTYLSVKSLRDLVVRADFYKLPALAAHLKKALREMSQQSSESWFKHDSRKHESPFYVAIGRKFKNYEELNKNFLYPSHKEKDNLLDLISDPDKYFVTTSFVRDGFSGGGVFNTDAELIGVNSMSPKGPKFLTKSFQPKISHVRIDYIKQKVREKLGDDMVREIFNCNK